MTTMTPTTTSTTSLAHELRSDRAHAQTAQRRVYEAETTLHAARQSGIDAWVAAAHDRLHEALISYVMLDQTAA
jgi:hypothetical protein